MNKFLSLLVCAAVGVLSLRLSGSAIYVDPSTGSDDEGDGSESAPYKTLGKGLEVSLEPSSLYNALYLGPGRYVLTNNVEFGRATNRGVENSIRLIGRSGNRDDVIIDGQGQYWWHQKNYERGICSVTFSNLYANATQALMLYSAGYGVDDGSDTRIFSNCVVTCCKTVGSGDTVNIVQMSGQVGMRDCVVRNCTAARDVVMGQGGCRVDCCEFTSNTAYAVVELTSFAYGDRDRYAASHASGSSFKGNGATSGVLVGVPVVENTSFVSNVMGNGVCVYNQQFSNTPIRMRESVFDSNTSTNAQNQTGCWGLFFNNASLKSSLIENCVFSHGSAPNIGGQWNAGGGAIRFLVKGLGGGEFLVRNVAFIDNDYGTAQGSILGFFLNQVTDAGTIRFENCTLAGNSVANNKTAVYFNDANLSSVFFVNCVFDTVYANGTHVHGIGGVSGWDAFEYSNMSNCLFASAFAHEFDAAQKIVNGADPLFAEGSYVPSKNSPLVDVGTNSAWMTTAYDLQRKPNGKPACKRIVNGTVDIGAYEYRAIPGLCLIVR